MSDDVTYSLREVATMTGASLSWMRKQLHKGTLAPAQAIGKHGQEYRLTDDDVDVVRRLYTGSSGAIRPAGHVSNAGAIQLARVAVEVAQALANERGEALARERERADRLEKELTDLRSMSAWRFLFGGRR